MMEFQRADLAPATIISVTHRPGLEEYFDREIHLIRIEEGGHATTRERRYPPLRNLWNRITRPGQNVA
jgi:putative ATP-binding cassette transporter